MKIAEEDFTLKLDLGCTYQIMLKPDALRQISQKEFKGKSMGIDIQGNRYEQPLFKIPEIRLGSLHFQHAYALEENELFITKGSKPLGIDKTLNKELQVIDGRIGCDFFRAFVCYLDLSQLIFWISSDLESLTEYCHLNEMTQAPFDFEKGLICVQFQTEQGPKNFILDTASSQTIMRKSSFKSTNKKVKIKNLQFGSLQIGKWSGYSLDFPEKLENVDGILGIDFFKKFAVCLDFPNQRIYLEPITLHSKFFKSSSFFASFRIR